MVVHLGAFGSESADFYLQASVRNQNRASEMDPRGRHYPRKPPTSILPAANPTTGMENCSKWPNTTSRAPPGSESADIYLEASVRNHYQGSEMYPEGRYYPGKLPSASHKVASPDVEIQNGRIGTVSTFRGHCGSTRLIIMRDIYMTHTRDSHHRWGRYSKCPPPEDEL